VAYKRKPIKIDRLDLKLMISIDRLANEFLKKTWAKTMEKADIDALVNITKLVKNLKKEQDELAAKASDAELENAAKGEIENESK